MIGQQIPQKQQPDSAPAATTEVATGMQDFRAKQEALLMGCVDRERGNALLDSCVGKEWFDLMVKQVLIHQLREEIRARHLAIKKLRREIREHRERRSPPAEHSTDAATRRSKKQSSSKAKQQ